MAYLFQQQARRSAFKGSSRTSSRSSTTDSERNTSTESKLVEPEKPALKRVPCSAPLSTFITALENDGCVIITDFTTSCHLRAAQQEIQPHLDAQSAGTKVGALTGKTRTATRLLSRSPTVREQFFSHPLYQSLVEHFLALTTTHWYDTTPKTTTSHPLLSIAITFDIPPSTPAQGLHRDDKNHHARHAEANSYAYGRDVLLGLFVPGCKTTRANGATRVVPGSHLWGDDPPALTGSNVVDAEMDEGEALIMLGSLYHGGGAYPEAAFVTPTNAAAAPTTTKAGLKQANQSELNESRTVHAMFCCSGVSRQEEIGFLTYSREEVRAWSELVQQRLGWRWSEPNLGWVDLKSPEFLLEEALGERD